MKKYEVTLRASHTISVTAETEHEAIDFAFDHVPATEWEVEVEDMGTISGPEMNDLISRAEVHKALSLLATAGGKDAKLLFSDAHEYIDCLPSAQPEIIRCKDCKWWRSDHTCQEHSLVSPMLANDFCSRAERIEE